MDVSKNRGTPKWMVKIREHPIRIDDLGIPLFLVQHPYVKFLPKIGSGFNFGALNGTHFTTIISEDPGMTPTLPSNMALLDVPDRKLGSMVIGSVGYTPNIHHSHSANGP